ncbi:MAG TPA: efflux RND transporter periplasmic adaptor subunit, partial [Bacteroidales bacterium]|nr:efflux RND transporter periplasmic adaptor subunit [Bacteroidales bacterium]
MKRTLIITGIVAAVIIIGLIVFNKLVSKKDKVSTYVEVSKGLFEVTVSNSGTLLAEKSLDIKGPEIARTSDQGGGGGNRGGGGMGRGGNMRAADFKIQDIIPEGTIVRAGDYIAQLDRTTYDNTLKDELTNLENYQRNLEMKTLDTAVTLSGLRDDIKNQRYVVEEAQITLDQSKYEPPATIRQAAISLDQAKRNLEQLIKGYSLRKAQALADIKQQKLQYTNEVTLVKNLQDFLAKFTITAPSPGIVIYKTDFGGVKRKSGSSINAFDRIVATLPDLTSMISKLYVSEIEVNKVNIGQKVDISVDAIPGKSLSGKVFTIANIGEVLPNSDAKMFEVQVKIDGTDNVLRPAMTTWNKIIIQSYNDAVYIPTECVQTGTDSIPYVFRKNHTKQIVVLGDMNEKNIIVKKGLEPGTQIYL